MQETEQEISLKDYFVPLTTTKIVCFIMIIGLVVFFSTLFNSFVLDDDWQITNSTLIHSLSNLPLFFTGSTFNSGGATVLAGNYYRPLMLVYFSLLYNFFGSTPFPYHLMQIVLYGFNAILAFFLFKKFFSKKLAFFLSLVFLVHPMNQEVAAYVSDSQDILFFMFGMLAVLFSMGGLKSIKKQITVSTFLLLSLIAKETAILFTPFILLASWVSKKNTQFWSYIAIMSLVILYLIFRFLIFHPSLNAQALFPIMQLSLVERFVSMPAIFFYYITTFIYPKQLAVEQLWIVSSPNLWHFYFPLLLEFAFLLLLGSLGVYIHKNKKEDIRAYYFFLGWFIAGISLSLQVIPLEMTVATRWFYFPMIGLLGLLGLGLRNIRIPLRFAYLLATCILIALSIRTMVRNTQWYNGITLYSHDLKTEDNFTLENDLGSILAADGLYDKALPYEEKSVAMQPYWLNLFNLGAIYLKKEEYNRAIYYFNESLQKGDYSLTYQFLTISDIYLKDIHSAATISEIGLKKFPRNASLWFLYGLSEYVLGNRQGGIEAVQHSVKIDPSVSSRNAVLQKMVKNQQITY